MPEWRHVVGYEEGDRSVTDKLVLGYPRFVYHPFVRRLVEVRGCFGVGGGRVDRSIVRLGVAGSI